MANNAPIPDDWIIAAELLLADAEDGEEPEITLTARQIVDASRKADAGESHGQR
jgi:hypothetical protein